MDTQMSKVRRLVIIVLAAAALIILIAVARGQKHHRGDETGATGIARVAVHPGADG